MYDSRHYDENTRLHGISLAMLQSTSTQCRQMMQTIQKIPAKGTTETMNQLSQNLVHMTKISEMMMKNREIAKKLHQIGQTAEQYRATSQRGTRIKSAPLRTMIKGMKSTSSEITRGVQKIVEKYKTPNERNMYDNCAPKRPENDEVTVKMSNCTKKQARMTSTSAKPKGRIQSMFTTTRYKVSNNTSTVLRTPRNKTNLRPGCHNTQSSPPPPPISTTNIPVPSINVTSTNVNGGNSKVHTTMPTTIPHIHVTPTNVNGGNSKVLPTIPTQIFPPNQVVNPTHGIGTPREHHAQVPSAPMYAANTRAAQAIAHDRSPMQDEEQGFLPDEKVSISTHPGAQAQSHTGCSFHSTSRTEPAPRLPNQAFHTRAKAWKTIIETKGIRNYTNSDLLLNQNKISNIVHAVSDSGATAHFIVDGAPVTNVKKADFPLKITCPNGGHIYSSHTCNLDIPWLPNEMTEAHIVPGIERWLIATRKFCNAGCQVVLTWRNVEFTTRES